MTTEIVFADGQRPAMDQVRQYFAYLFEAEESGDPFPVDLDTVWPIAYASKGYAKRDLVKPGSYYENEDYIFVISDKNYESPGKGRPRDEIRLSIPCFEFFIARKSRPVFELYRECRKAVTEAAKSRPPLRAKLPYHLTRYLANHDKVPFGYFSILQEITTRLIGPLEFRGYDVPANMMPDVSVGQIFCRWLRETKKIDPSQFKTYDHVFEDGRVVKAKLYPNELLSDFVKHFQEEWIRNRAAKYFQGRDAEALPFIAKLLEGPRKRPELDS